MVLYFVCPGVTGWDVQTAAGTVVAHTDTEPEAETAARALYPHSLERMPFRRPGDFSDRWRGCYVRYRRRLGGVMSED